MSVFVVSSSLLMSVLVTAVQCGRHKVKVVEASPESLEILMALTSMNSDLQHTRQQLSRVRRHVKTTSLYLDRTLRDMTCMDSTVNHTHGPIPAQRECPSSLPLLYQNSCYRVEPERLTWKQAHKLCAGWNSHLVTMETRDEQHFLMRHLKNSEVPHCDFWAGGSDAAEEGHWRWLPAGDPVLGSGGWHAGEPNGGSRENCMLLDWYFAWQWNDVPCHGITACVICEQDGQIGKKD